MDSSENGFFPDEIETRVGRDSDQKRRRRFFFHDVHEAFLSKQTALASSNQALNHAGASDAGEMQAWRTFRAAAEAEGWLAE
jgi:hypothetical protein